MKVLIPKMALVAAVPFVAAAFSERPNYRTTGAPGDQASCALCHRDAPSNAAAGRGRVLVSFPNGPTYTPGVAQEWTVTVDKASGKTGTFGFQLTARLATDLANGQAGDFRSTDASTLVLCDDNGIRGAEGCPVSASVQFIEQRQAGSGNTWRLIWNPPRANAGSVRVYVAGLAGNGNRSVSGDELYQAEYELTPAAGQPAPPVVLRNGVVNGASFQPGIAASAWITIFGDRLASTTRTWRGDEIVAGKLPLGLDDVLVTVNNKPAAVYYISPNQLNVQAPADDALGPVEVQVTNARGTSVTTALMTRFAPGFFKFDAQGRRYLAAVHADGSLVGPPNLLPGASVRPAAPGDTILLYGTGFGPTNPAVPAGEVLSAPAVLANPVVIQIGGLVADIRFAGLTGAGLYQFNVVVPEAPDGDVAVTAEIGGVSTAGADFVSIQRR